MTAARRRGTLSSTIECPECAAWVTSLGWGEGMAFDRTEVHLHHQGHRPERRQRAAYAEWERTSPYAIQPCSLSPVGRTCQYADRAAHGGHCSSGSEVWD